MENRRPPRSNSSGRKPYADRSRGPSNFGSGVNSTGSFRRKPPNSASGTRDPQYREGTGTQPYRKDTRGNFNRKPGNNRYADRNGPGRNNIRPSKRTMPEQPDIKITSDSQITDGRLRGKALSNSPSPAAVHTARKLRESAFKILARRIKAARVLDLGAGSGMVGIEAISRGAMLATFVERSARMCSFVRRNLTELGIKDGHGEVVEMEIMPFLIKCGRRKRCWDIVFLSSTAGDQNTDILNYLSRGLSIRTGGLLILEHGSGANYPEQLVQLKRWRTIDQGETILSIYERM